MDFRSDVVSGAHPAIIEALVTANQGSAAAYGEDAWTQRLARRFGEIFEHDVAVLPVASGTAANALSLATFVPPWGAIYCHADAHISVAECGAPELFTGGARLALVAGDHGKISPAAVEGAIRRAGDVHAVQPAAISISQASEVGTVYRPEEIGALGETARRHRMALHVDGARFANALVALGKTPAELTWKAGVDVLSFGATKNGCIAAEAIVLFDADKAQELGYRRKRGGHLLSKSRFLAAQLEGYLTDDLWLGNARHANAMTRRLAEGLERGAGIRPLQSVESNQLFVVFAEPVASALRAAGFLFLDWPALGPGACRLVASFQTSAYEVDALIGAAATAMGAPSGSPSSRARTPPPPRDR